ncbi:MAG TPA: beta-galactosidase [Candidatus Ornithomonoglobus intestinigallinarum]|uniref:Beta-galactosidase n=1 Tax=Candidatus Ornithomonoglobus intestinigallinarum TaxID=2840894 RepID=A0A9D1H1E3_9FIRM|nr:beta-galactosidase [Candidatus Ornithomonoglobus intestinigallinarum]
MKIFKKFICFSVVCPIISGCFFGGLSAECNVNAAEGAGAEITSFETKLGIADIEGKYSLGAGHNITMTITDEAAESIFALAQTKSGVGGGFSFSAELPKEAAEKTLTLKLSDAEGEIYSEQFEYLGNGGIFDFVSFREKQDGENIEISDLSYVEPNVRISGSFGGGAGYDIEYRVTDDETGEQYASGTVKSKNKGAFTVSLALPQSAAHRELTCFMLAEDQTDEAYVTFVFDGGIDAYRAEIAEYVSVISGLISECEQKNISVEYEKSNLGIINKFAEFLDEFYEKGLAEEYEHNYNGLIDIAVQTESDLRAYLDGTKAEKAAPKYISSDVRIEGNELIAQTELKGETKERPVYFNGLGHWPTTSDEFGDFEAMGINSTHFEIGPSDVLSSINPDGTYNINREGIERVKQVLADAEENDISVVLLTAMHYFPDFIYEQYPEIGSKDDLLSFMPYYPTHPKVEEAIASFLNALIPEIKNYNSLQSVCMANEPLLPVWDYREYYNPEYRQYLKDKYGSVSALNAAYGTSFGSFDDIVLTGSESNKARYTDCREFGDTVLTEWFGFIADTIHNIDPSIPVHIKCSAYIASGGTGSRRTDCGTNSEQWADVSDINGCDAWAIYGENEHTLQGKMMWYDFMMSVKDAPIVNSEDHILRESNSGTVTYDDNELKVLLADAWQGAVHGKSGSVWWLWDTSSRTDSGTWYYNTNLSKRIDYVAGISKVNHDLNRLSEELAKIRDKKPRTAVLYSNYTQSFTSDFNAVMYAAYKRLQNNGEKVYIASDSNPAAINENENLELIVVPACAYMPEEMWRELKKFEEHGKKIIFAERTNGYFDENGKALNASLLNETLSGGERVTFGDVGSDGIAYGCDALYKAIDSAVSELPRSVSLEHISDELEWIDAETDGGYLINMCNYGETDEEIRVNINGGYEKLIDLTNNETVGEGSIILKPYETKLVKAVTCSDVNEIVNEQGKAELSAGTMTANVSINTDANKPIRHIFALYKDEQLVELVSNEVISDKNGNARSSLTIKMNDMGGGYSMKSFVWENSKTMKPLTKACGLK